MKPEISIIPEPDTSTVPRKPLTKKQRAEILLAQDGYCGCGCGVKVDHAREGSIDEHMDPLGLTGTNDLENRRIYRLPCAKAKTKDDIARIAKSRAMAGETGQRARREKNGSRLKSASRWPPKGSAKLQSRKFRKEKE